MSSDGDIRFPPPERREKPKFEPPPWEREQFDEMARRTQEAQPASEEPAAPSVANVGPAAGPAQQAPIPAEQGATARESKSPEAGSLDEKDVEIMMMGLRAEEPRPEKEYHRVVIASGIVSMIVGLVVMTWAIAIMASPRNAGTGEKLFEAMLAIFGLGFVIGGGVIMFRSLRQQGVL